VIYALIPIKDLGGAKARLDGVLADGARRELVVAMYRDVLAAATSCSAIDRVSVVSNDADALAIAKSAGAEAIPDGPSSGSGPGLNDALTSAAQALAARGAKRLIVLLADLPLANVAAIERVARADADVAIVPSPDGGTNALVLAPGALEFQYGPGSAAKHIAAAEAAGLRVATLDELSLQLDIDTRDDLERLVISASVGEHTAGVLRAIGTGNTVTQRG
jgi:2-phospho-L-lactate guanylyltransferase